MENKVSQTIDAVAETNGAAPGAEQSAAQQEKTDDEIIDVAAKRVLDRYLPAFKELAK